MLQTSTFNPETIDWDLIPDSSIEPDEARKYFYVKDGYVYAPPAEKLNIFGKSSVKIPEWEPTAKFKKYQELSAVILDIETLRINNALKDIRARARANRVMSIGVMNEKKDDLYIQDSSEAWMLQQLFDLLERKQPDILVTHNGMWFDLPFIVERARVLGLRCPFWIDYDRKPSRFASAAIAGMHWQTEFRAVHIRLKSGKRVSHIDTFMCAIRWDAVMRKLTKHTLKSIPLELGLREEERLDLGIEGIEECYAKGDWDTLHAYLKFDLEDTKLLADRFIPEVVNAQSYFPGFTLQALATVGVGTQWNAALSEDYDQAYLDSLDQPVSRKYQGAITIANAGFYQNVVGYDWSGQYPSCMKQYGIYSEKDPEKRMLARLNHAVENRMTLKYKEERTGQKLTKAEKDFVTTVKAVVNGAYGALAAKIPFGDPIAAAIVTAFARARIKWSIQFLERLGGKLVLTDTDSVFFYTEQKGLDKLYPIDKVTLETLPPNASEELLSAIAIGEELKRNIPDGALMDLDSVNRIFFVPPVNVPKDFNKSYKFGSVNGLKFAAKCLGEHDENNPKVNKLNPEVSSYILSKWGDKKVTFEGLKDISDRFYLGFPSYEGIKKNYIKLVWNYDKENPEKSKYKLKAKGKFVKRDRTQLEKQFQQRYIELYAADPKSAEAYYKKLLAEIITEQCPVDMLTVTRKIRVNEKKLVELGFGAARDTVSFYRGRSGEYVQTGAYDAPFYASKLHRLHSELVCLMRDNVVIELPEK